MCLKPREVILLNLEHAFFWKILKDKGSRAKMLILLWFYTAHSFFNRFKHVIWLWYMLSLQYVYEHLKWRLYEFWKFNMFWETFGLIACTISILNIGFIKVFEFKKYFWTLEHGNISRFKSVWQFFHSQNSFQIHVFSKSNSILHDLSSLWDSGIF